MTDETDSSIRAHYERLGVREFYSRRGATYANPHEAALGDALRLAISTWSPDLSHILDLACGSGEATLVLQSLGAGKIDGADPFTGEAYLARTGRPAEPIGFEAVADGALTGRHYTLIVCSYALHLAEPSRLPGIATQLSMVAPALLILTPHKRPVLRPEWGWSLQGELVEQRVRARMYGRK